MNIIIVHTNLKNDKTPDFAPIYIIRAVLLQGECGLSSTAYQVSALVRGTWVSIHLPPTPVRVWETDG